jgi:hypothetical protein
MGAESIQLGLTIDDENVPQDETEIRALVQEHIAALNEKMDLIDASGLYTLDYYETDEEMNAGVTEALVQATVWLKNGETDQAIWEIPGYPHLAFITAGGQTWGDSPFDEFDAVVLLGNAASEVPAFGRAVGVLGGGLKTDYSG